MVSVLRELGIPMQTIQMKIQEVYGLSPEASKNIYKTGLYKFLDIQREDNSGSCCFMAFL